MSRMRCLLGLLALAPCARAFVSPRSVAGVRSVKATAASEKTLAESSEAGRGVRAPRRIARRERPTRLPVWPVLNGLALTALDLVGQAELAARLEHALGGRVAPMMLNARAADPFVLLVHHRHAFRPLDFFRPLFSAVIMPEGFPAHPHRGFETVRTCCPSGRASSTATLSG